MKSQLRNVSADLQTIVRCWTRSSTSINGGEYSLPVDIIIEILSRFPAKLIARYRCVSKFWAAILACQDLTDLFLTRSYARLQLLFVCVNDDENSSPLTANHHMKIPFGSLYEICNPISSSLVISRQDSLNDFVICNPSTRQSFTLPKMKTRLQMKSFYPTHYPGLRSICINGVLYYEATTNGSIKHRGVICFDVRSEKYSFVRALHSTTILINYKGKLASLKSDQGFSGFQGTNRSFKMHVLEDPGKQEWSKHVYKLPSLWKNVVGEEASFISVCVCKG